MRACLLILFCAWACTEAARFGHGGSSESKESGEDDGFRFGHRGHGKSKHSFRVDDDKEFSASHRKVTVESTSATSTTQAAEINEEPLWSVNEDNKARNFLKEIEDSISSSREEAKKELVDALANHMRANSKILKNPDDPDKRHHVFIQNSFDYNGRQFHFNASGADHNAGKCVHEFPTFDNEPIYIYSRDLTEEEQHAAMQHGGHGAVSKGPIEGAKHGDLIIQTNGRMQYSHGSDIPERVRKWQLFSRINVIAFSCQEGAMCCGITCCSEDTKAIFPKESKPKSDRKVITDAVKSETKYIVVSYPAVAIIFQAVAVSLILGTACFAFYICSYVRKERHNQIYYAKLPPIPVAASV